MNLQDLKEIAKIRNRGQLTIPCKIREVLNWLESDSLIEIVPKKIDRIEMRPLISLQQKKLKKTKSNREINALWRKMRAIGRVGRQIKLSEFILKDRERH